MNSIETKEGSFSGTSESGNPANDIDQIAQDVIRRLKTPLLMAMDSRLSDIYLALSCTSGVEEISTRIVDISKSLSPLTYASSALETKAETHLIPVIADLVNDIDRTLNQSLDS